MLIKNYVLNFKWLKNYYDKINIYNKKEKNCLSILERFDRLLVSTNRITKIIGSKLHF